MDMNLEVFNTLRDPLFRVSQKGETIFANRSCGELYRVSAKDLQGLQFADWLDPATSGALQEFTAFASLENREFSREVLFRGPLETTKSIRWSFDAFFDQRNEIDFIQICGNNITEVVEREAQIKRASEQFNSLFHNSPVPFWREDFSSAVEYIDQLRLQGVEDFEAYFREHEEEVWETVKRVRILDVNQATLDSICYPTKVDLLGNLDSTVHQNSLIPFREEVIALAKGDTSFYTELPFVRGDGKTVNSLIFINFPEDRSLCDDVLVVHIDVTELKNTQRALEISKAEAESANEAKSTFVSKISHEIRTPLNGIIGFGNLLAKEPLEKTQQEFLSVIRSCSDMLLALINQVLDLSKIEAVKMEVNRESFHLHKLLDEVATVNRLAADQVGSTLDLLIEPNVPELVTGDRLKINQILTNLVRNAVKFCENGKIVIKSGILGDFIEIRISDTGLGIDESALETIFQPFSQVDHSNTDLNEGTGLGLTIAYELAKLIEGDLALESKKGVGTQCTLKIPLDTTELDNETVIVEKVSDVPCPVCFGEMDVLIVDDNRLNIRLLEHLLKPKQLRVHSCLNGQEAIEFLSEHHCDAVFMDIQMPVLDGYGATRLIRDGAAGLHNTDIPIAIVSANAMLHDEKRAEALSIEHFIAKPIASENIDAFIDFAAHAKRKYLESKNEQNASVRN